MCNTKYMFYLRSLLEFTFLNSFRDANTKTVERITSNNFIMCTFADSASRTPFT